MVSLFIVFDPISIIGVSLNWLGLFFVVMFLPGSFYFVAGRMFGVFNVIMVKVGMIFKEVAFPNGMGLVEMVMGLFFFVGVSNIIGLFSYIFVVTSHLVVTLSLGLVMWFSFFLMGWVMEFKASSAHLVPEGSPILLSPVMVLIELISHLIRPFTLSIRLSANMMAGHLILGLISSMSLISFWGGLFSVLLQSMMMVLEFFVAIIQAFVISILVMLYSLEYH